MVLLALVVVVIVVVWMIGISTNNSGPTKVQLMTNMGNIVIELRDDMPITSGNFEKLVQEGLYDGTIFHRVIDGFVIQGGDPTGTGEGDPSIPSIPSEVIPGNNKNDRGTIAMALKGNPPDPDSASSQFFINLIDNNDLDDDYAVFGRVIEGMEVVDQIAKVEVEIESSKPINDVIINKAELID